MSREIESISVYDDKYTLVWGPDTPLHALRYGEPWRDLCGDGMVFALCCEIVRLREQVKELQDD